MSRHRFSAAEDDLIRSQYPDISTDEIAKRIGVSLQSVYTRAHRLGLKKSAAFTRRYLAKCGLQVSNHPRSIAARIKKGNIPPNKGKKMPPGYAPGRMRETQFKKGQRSRNSMPLGSVRDVDGYLYVKISTAPEPPGQKGGSSPNWKPLHFKVWEDAGNPPVNTRTHVLSFKDGNRKNCVIDN